MITGGRTQTYAFLKTHMQEQDNVTRGVVDRYQRCDPVINCLQRIKNDRY